MKKFILLVVIVGAFFAYTSSLDEVTKAQYKATSDDMIERWFGIGEDDPAPAVNENEPIRVYRATHVTADESAGDVDFESVSGNLYATDGFLTIGIDDAVCHTWEAGAEYTTGRFRVVGEAPEGCTYTVSVLDVKGDEKLLDIIEFFVIDAPYTHSSYEETPIEEFSASLAPEGEEVLAYRILARMPDELPEGYEYFYISEISLEITVAEAE